MKSACSRIYLLFIVNPLIRWLIRSTDLTAGNQLLVGKCIVCSGTKVFNQLQFLENISLAWSIILEFSQDLEVAIMGMKRKFVSRKDDSEEELDPMLLHEPEIRRPTRQDNAGCFFLYGSSQISAVPKRKTIFSSPEPLFHFSTDKASGWLVGSFSCQYWVNRSAFKNTLHNSVALQFLSQTCFSLTEPPILPTKSALNFSKDLEGKDVEGMDMVGNQPQEVF